MEVVTAQPVRTPAHVGEWAGAVAVGAAALWLAVAGDRALDQSRELGRALSVAQTRTVGPGLIAVVALVFLLERRWPAVPRPARSRAHVVDAGYLLIFAAVTPFVTLLDTGFAVAVHRWCPFLVLGRLPLAPQLLAVVATLLGIDGLNWLAHLGNHRSPVLWRFHALHHSQEDMSVLTTFRTHPLSHFSYVAALLPALVLSASGTLPALALIVYGCFVTLPHANLRWSFGPLGRVLVSPAYHRLHHASAPVGGRAVVNFGFVLTIWDRLAGLAVDPVPGRVLPTGIAGRLVPVEQESGRRGAVRLGRLVGAQLVQPFRITLNPNKK